MDNNYTDINKTNIHLSPKESLNSNGEQSHREVIVCFVDVSVIVVHDCLNFL
jgi:hypothetical protein